MPPRRPLAAAAATLAVALPLLAATAPSAAAADVPADASTRAVARIGINLTPGTWERSGDRDWFRVRLVRGRAYVIRTDLLGRTPDPPWRQETVLRDARGRALARVASSTTDALEFPIIAFVAPATGTYFVDAGGTAAAPTRSGLGYGVLVSPDCAASARTACVILPGREPPRHIQTVNDVDWLRASLGAGRSYTIELAGGQTTFALALVDARGRRVATGESPGPGSAVIRNFVPPASGDYYAVVTATEPGLIFAGYSVVVRSP
jgi:hypothetical protein